MKSSGLISLALVTLVAASFSFQRAPLQTVEVYVINNCHKDLEVRIEADNENIDKVNFSKGEKRNINMKVGSLIEVGDGVVHIVGAGDSGAKVYLCM